jgi:hypothetical protein
MAWDTLQPESIEQLHQALTQLHENRKHVKSVVVDHQNRVIRVDLDWLANTKVKDFMIPLKQGVTTEVDEIVRVMWGESERGIAPGRGAAEKIYSYIDTSHR